MPKGDALAVARIAGIQAAKRTPELIPLAHPIGVHGVEVDLEVTDDGVELRATVRTADRTGIEMEALTAVTVAALALIDMVKAVDKHARITDVRVTAKSGGRSGDWVRVTRPTRCVITCSDAGRERGLPRPVRPGHRRGAAQWDLAASSSTTPSSCPTGPRSRPRCAPRWTPAPRWC